MKPCLGALYPRILSMLINDSIHEKHGIIGKIMFSKYQVLFLTSVRNFKKTEVVAHTHAAEKIAVVSALTGRSSIFAQYVVSRCLRNL